MSANADGAVLIKTLFEVLSDNLRKNLKQDNILGA
jgi:hypothetical protein